jgi:hypothetical protein
MVFGICIHFTKRKKNMSTIIVTGSVRCGSSLTMRMLESCGIPIIQDGFKQPDTQNPNGYYETRQVYAMNNGNFDVLNDSDGKAVKILPPTIVQHMPNDRQFKTIFLLRDPLEVSKSFYKYHVHRATLKEGTVMQTEEQYLSHFIPDHLRRINTAKEWVNTHSNFDVLWVEHNALMNTPLVETRRICEFLSTDFPQYTYDPAAMAALVDLNLYTQRQSTSP